MRLNRFLATLMVPLALATAGSAATIDFDDIAAPFTDLATISPYQGFDWTAFNSYDTTLLFNAYPNGIVSTPNAVFSGGEFGDPGSLTQITGSIEDLAGFTLNSGYFGAAHLEGQQLSVVGSNLGAFVFSTTITLTTLGAQQFFFNQTGLTRVDFTPIAGSATSDPFGCGSFNCTQFTLDDLVVNEAVPEPATALLAFASLTGVFFLRRRARTAHK